MSNLISASFLSREVAIVVINSLKAFISNIINNIFIIVVFVIIKARYDLFAKRVAFLKNIKIENSELKYNLTIIVVEKDNEKNSDLFLIIGEKKSKKVEDLNI